MNRQTNRRATHRIADDSFGCRREPVVKRIHVGKGTATHAQLFARRPDNVSCRVFAEDSANERREEKECGYTAHMRRGHGREKTTRIAREERIDR